MPYEDLMKPVLAKTTSGEVIELRKYLYNGHSENLLVKFASDVVAIINTSRDQIEFLLPDEKCIYDVITTSKLEKPTLGRLSINIETQDLSFISLDLENNQREILTAKPYNVNLDFYKRDQ